MIAALARDGETLIDRIYHLDRGYDRMEVEADGGRREGAPHQGQRERAMSSVPQTSSSVGQARR